MYSNNWVMMTFSLQPFITVTNKTNKINIYNNNITPHFLICGGYISCKSWNIDFKKIQFIVARIL